MSNIMTSAEADVSSTLFDREERKNRIVKLIIGYYRRYGKPPTKRDIRRKLHLEVYHYFKNLAEACKVADVEPNPRSLSAEEIKQKIVNFVRNNALKGKFPLTGDLESKFKVKLNSYFCVNDSLTDVYNIAGIPFIKALKERKERIDDARHKRARFKSVKEGRQKISKFVKEQVNKNIYPTARDVYDKFKIAFYHYFDSMEELYKLAGADYRRMHAFAMKDKEVKLTEIVIALLKRIGWKVERVSIHTNKGRNTGVDIIATDNDKKRVGIELKALHKNMNFAGSWKEQFERYSKNYDKMVVITTSDTSPKLSHIEVINGKMLGELLYKHNLSNLIPILEEIRERKLKVSKEDVKEGMRRKIADFMVRDSKSVSRRQIEKALHIDLRTYFANMIKAHKYAKINSSSHLPVG